MPPENSKSLSIVIPVFNEINFLYKLFDQIKSHFNSENIEIIIVDDGSTDGSSNLLKEIKEKKTINLHSNLSSLILILVKERQFKQV